MLEVELYGLCVPVSPPRPWQALLINLDLLYEEDPRVLNMEPQIINMG